jgi:hypothetical protein
LKGNVLPFPWISRYYWRVLGSADFAARLKLALGSSIAGLLRIVAEQRTQNTDRTSSVKKHRLISRKSFFYLPLTLTFPTVKSRLGAVEVSWHSIDLNQGYQSSQTLVDMSLLTRNLCRTATRSLRQPAFNVTKRALLSSKVPAFTPKSLAPAAAKFSTTTAMASGPSSAPTGTVKDETDQVLVDIADYIHNYKIDSDLAVSLHCNINPRFP